MTEKDSSLYIFLRWLKFLTQLKLIDSRTREFPIFNIISSYKFYWTQNAFNSKIQGF